MFFQVFFSQDDDLRKAYEKVFKNNLKKNEKKDNNTQLKGEMKKSIKTLNWYSKKLKKADVFNRGNFGKKKKFFLAK